MNEKLAGGLILTAVFTGLGVGILINRIRYQCVVENLAVEKGRAETLAFIKGMYLMHKVMEKKEEV